MAENQEIKPLRKPPTFVDEYKNTALHYAAAKGNTEDVLKEIKAGSIVDPENDLGWTPLMMAMRWGHFEVVQVLLDHRADSTRKNKFCFSVFFMAIASGKLELVHLILQHLLQGGISRQSLQNSFSPIALAVLFENVKIIQYLLDKGFCINSTASTGLNPLSFASALDKTEIINMLVQNGAKGLPQAASSGMKHVTHVPPSLILVNPPIIPAMMPPQSSALMNPSPYFTGNITPISNMPQIFFPPTFSPSYYVSPGNNITPNNEFLNVRFMHVNSIYSPMIPYNISA